MSGVTSVDMEAIADEGFPSAMALRAAHSGLLRRERIERDMPAFRDEVAAFIQRGRVTGRILDDEAERRASQSMLDYWATVLYRADEQIIDSTLDPFDPALAPTLPDALCPYVGLDAFRESHRNRFFGRRRLLETLLERIGDHRLLAVVGPSGSGKSSLVLGGLLPALKAGALPASQQWHYVPAMVPGSDPLANLARALRPASVTSDSWVKGISAGALHDPTCLTKVVRALTKQPVVLVVDQFEEVFTLCANAHVREAFINNLLVLATVAGPRHTVILTMRSDFESFVARVPHLQARFEQGQVRVTPMSAGELREAIEEPARQVGLKIEPRVVDALVNDIIGEPAALPLLQFTLLKLWEQRDHNRVTWEAYQRVGGGRLALARSADAFYNSLTPEQQRAVRRMLMRMVRPAEGLEFTSNRVRRSQLYQGSEAAYRIDEVLGKLVQARLVRMTEADRPEDTQVEVAHEALVRNWPTLVDWLEAERDALRERQRLTLAAENWKARGEDPEALLRGATLSDALRLPTEHLGQLEREFLRASLREKLRVEQEQEAARQREIAQARALAEEQRLRAEEQAQRAKIERKRAEERARAARRLRWAALALGVALIVAAVAAIYAFRNATVADQQRIVAEHAGATSQANTISLGTAEARARAAGIDANHARETAEIAQQTAQAKAQTSGMAKVQAEATAHAIATAKAQADSSRAQAEAAAAQARTAEADNAARANALQQTTTAQAIFANTLQQTAEAQRQTLQSQLDAGKLVDKAMQALNADNTEHALQLAIAASTFSKEQKVEDALQAAITQSTPAIRHGRNIASISWSPDNQHLVSVGTDMTVRIWDTSRQQMSLFGGHSAQITDAVWSPDGSRIVSTDTDGYAIVWEAATGKELTRFIRHTEAVRSASWSPDSRLIVSIGDDNVLRIWEAMSGRQVNSVPNVPADITETAWKPDGKLFVVATRSDAVIYDADGNKIATLSDHNGPVRSAAWNPNSKTIATASDDGTVKIWDAKSGQLQTTVHASDSGGVNSARWYPSGNYLVTAGDDHVARIWDMKDVAQPRQLATLNPGGTPVMAAWNANGLRLATASSDGSIRIYYVLFDDILKEAQRLTHRQLTDDEIKAELEQP